jgi:opacity protein-like surface antigen
LRKLCGLLLLSGCFSPAALRAQRQYYVGTLGGIATLSGAGQTVVTPSLASVSLYSTRNGPAVNLFAGVHLSDYVSLQGNYMWNRNDLTLTSTASAGVLQDFYHQPRSSSQHSVIADLLVYMRDRGSRVRPYLSGGVGPVHLSSSINGQTKSEGALKGPPQEFTSTFPGFRVAVGMDVRLSGGWSFRYSFSETISRNPISAEMQPRPSGLLKNFQNLFGIMRTF